MLIDKEQFETIEQELIANGKLADFVANSGEIKGRMMITLGEVPDNIEVRAEEGRPHYAFEASFDWCDAVIGIAMFPDTVEPASDMWLTPQKAGAGAPPQEWIEFFVEQLFEGFKEDGSFAVPIYSFVSETSEMTIYPDRLLEEEGADEEGAAGSDPAEG